MRALIVKNGRAEISDIPRPEPADGEVLIRVDQAGICSTDLEILKGYFGFEGILGHEFVGTVIGGSKNLAEKRVVADINCVCGRCDSCSSGLSNHCPRRTVVGISGRPGVFAEYVALPERNCHLVPDSVSNEEAVFAEPLAAALQVCRQVKIEPRMQVAVLGTGRLGLLVAQVLSGFECALTAIGRNARTLGILDRRGIRTATPDSLPNRQNHHLVIECTGSPDGLGLALELVRPRGTVILKTTCQQPQEVSLTPAVVNEVNIVGSRCGPMGESVSALARKQIDVACLVTGRMPLSSGLDALKHAASPDHIKVLLQATE